MSSPTLADYVCSVQRHMDGSLIEPEYFERIRSVAGRFPALLTQIFGFELYLGCPTGRADFAFKITGQAEAKQDLRMALSNQEYHVDKEKWAALSVFCAAWAQEGSRFQRNLTDICLEFDIDTEGDLSLPPALFCDLRPQNSSVETAGLFSELVTCFQGPLFQNLSQKTFADCLDYLPAPAAIRHLGFLLSRPAPFVRLAISRLAMDRIPAYLQKLRWPGSLKALEEALNLIDGQPAAIRLTLDAGKGLSPKAGLELFFKENKLPTRPYPWQDFLDKLVAWGLCRAEKREGILNFNGLLNDPACKPLPLIQAEQLFSHHRRVSIKKISHFKVVVEADGTLSAKAYLEARHYWLTLNKSH